MGVQRAAALCRGCLGVSPKHKTPLIEGWGGAPTEREWGEAVTRPPKTEFLRLSTTPDTRRLLCYPGGDPPSDDASTLRSTL